MKNPVSVVITDLDNTLFDWVDVWYRSFSAMLDSLVQSTGLDQAQFEAEFKAIFERHATSEYAFAIEELPCLRALHPVGTDLAEKYSTAIQAFRDARRAALKLYPNVATSLEELRDRGCLIIGYTESMEFYSNYRLRKLGLDRLLDFMYSPADHALPEGRTPADIRLYGSHTYQLRRTVSRHTPKGERKPNPDVLRQILRDVGASPHETIYVGDSLMKDIAMAQAVGVNDVWAKYGVANGRCEYELLRRVTHWTKADVERERKLSPTEVKPACALDDSFEEIFEHFTFTAFVDRSREHVALSLEAWKKTIDVQQHFNDLELRIRNYAITVVVAIVGAVAFALKEHMYIRLGRVTTPLAAGLLFAGLLGWLAFYFMDRWWYHRLLYGAVKHGAFIEKRLARILPEIALTESIGRESPVSILGLTIRSTRKMDVFYLGIAALLVVMIIALHISAPAPVVPPDSSNSAEQKRTSTVTAAGNLDPRNHTAAQTGTLTSRSPIGGRPAGDKPVVVTPPRLAK